MRCARAAAAASDGGANGVDDHSDVRYHRRHTDSGSVRLSLSPPPPDAEWSTSGSSHANVFDNHLSVTLPPDHERYDCDYFDGDGEGDGDGDECEIDAEGQEEMEKTVGSVSASASRQQGSDNEGDDPPTALVLATTVAVAPAASFLCVARTRRQWRGRACGGALSRLRPLTNGALPAALRQS